MAAPSFRSKGAFGNGTTSATAAVPTGGGAPVAGDVLLIFLESADAFNAGGTPNTPSGWTKKFEETQSEGNNGCTTLTIFAKIAAGGDSDVTVDGAANHHCCIMLCYQGAKGSVDDVGVGTGNGADTGNGTVLGVTTPVADCLVIAAVSSTRDANATDTTFSAWTNGNLGSLTERHDQTATSGAGGGVGIADGTKSAAGATGDTTVTIGVSDKWRGVHLYLQPAATTLVIQNADDAHTSDNLALVQHNILAIADSAHAHTSDNLALVQHNILAIQDSAHAHTSDNLVLTAHDNATLVIQNADNAHSSDNLALVQHNILVIQDAAHAHTSDNLALVQHNVLVIQDCLSSSSSDNVVLVIDGGDEHNDSCCTKKVILFYLPSYRRH